MAVKPRREPTWPSVVMFSNRSRMRSTVTLPYQKSAFGKRFAILAAIAVTAWTASPHAQVSPTTTAIYTTWDSPSSTGYATYLVVDREGASGTASPAGTVWYGRLMDAPFNSSNSGFIVRFQPGQAIETDQATWTRWPAISGVPVGVDISSLDQLFYTTGFAQAGAVERLDPATNQQTSWATQASGSDLTLAEGPNGTSAWFPDMSGRIARLVPAGPASTTATLTRWGVPTPAKSRRS